jgi:hypothetical protein
MTSGCEEEPYTYVKDGFDTIQNQLAQRLMLRLARKGFLSIYFFQYAGISKTMTV